MVVESGKTEVARKGDNHQPIKSANKMVAESGKTEVVEAFSSATQSFADLVSSDTGYTEDEKMADLSKEDCSSEDKCKNITSHIEAQYKEVIDDWETLKPATNGTDLKTKKAIKMTTSNEVICESPQADSGSSVDLKTKNRDMSSSSLSVLRNEDKCKRSDGQSLAPFNSSNQKQMKESVLYSATGLSNGNRSHFDHLKGAVLNHDNKSLYKSNANAGQSNGENLVGNSESKDSHSTVFCKDKLSSQCRNIKQLDLVQLFQSRIGFQSSGKTCSYASSMESFTRFIETGESTCHSAEPEMACDIPSAIGQDTEALDLRENITYIQEALNECGRFSQRDVPILFTDHGKQTIREALNDCGRFSQNDVPKLATDNGKQTIREALNDCGRLSENDVPKLSSDHSKQQRLIKEDEEAEAKPGLEISTGTFNKLKDGMDSHIKAEIPNEADNHNKVPSKSSSKLAVSSPKPLESKYKPNKLKSRPKAAGYRNKFAVAYLMQDSIIQNEEEHGVQNVSNVKKEKVFQVNEENKEPLKTYCQTPPQLSSGNLDTTPIEPNVKSMKSKHSELHERLQPIPGFQELQKAVHTEWQPSLCIQEHAVNETEESSEDSVTDSTESDSVTDDEDSSSESMAQNAHTLSKAKSGRSNVIENENLSLRHPPFAKVSTHLFHTRSHQQDQQKESGTVPLHSYKRNKAEYSSYNDSQDSGQKACGNGVEHDYERHMHNWQNEYQSWCARFQNPAMAHYPPFYGQSADSGLYDSWTSSFPYPYYNDPFGDWYPQYPGNHHEGSRSSHSGDLRKQFNKHFEIQNRYLKEMSRYVWNNRLKK